MATELMKRGQTDIVREGYFDLSPRSLSEAIQLAELMSKSDLIPQQFRGKSGDILIAVQYGAEIGLKPLQAMQGIAVINGRPTVWGDAALAVVLNSGLMVNHKEMTLDEIEAAGKAVFWAQRRGTPEPIVREFSIENAKKANLWGKAGPWQQYPFRMLQMRARSWALRDGFSDVLRGLAVREEVDDYQEAPAPHVLAMPRRISERPQTEPPPPQLADPTHEEPPKAEEVPPPVCEICNKNMTLRQAGKATDTGRSYPAFWACPERKKVDGKWNDHSTINDEEYRKGLESRDPGQEG